jgi:hypothetical protein
VGGLAQDDACGHSGQGIEVAGEGALRFVGIQLLHGLSYGSIYTAAVAHGFAPFLYGEAGAYHEPQPFAKKCPVADFIIDDKYHP